MDRRGPSYSLVVAPKEVLCVARDRQPSKHPHVTWTEAKGLLDMSLGVLAPIEMKLMQTDYRVSHGQVSVERHRLRSHSEIAISHSV